MTRTPTRIDAIAGRARRPAPRSQHGLYRRRRRIFLVATLAILIGIAAIGGLLSGAGRSPITSRCTVATTSGAGSYRLTPEQAQNASIVAAVGMKLGLPDHAVTIALAAALQESGLRDLPYGDRDSVGLFQQRPSQGWGTRTQILDPVYATAAFYSRLTQQPGWETMAVTDAAQAIQHSAAPSAYAQWEQEARALAAALTGESPATFACRLSGFAGPSPSASALAAAEVYEMGRQLTGTPVGSKTGWRVAGWVVAHSWQYHIRRVTYGSWTWTYSSGNWSQRASTSGVSSTVAFS